MAGQYLAKGLSEVLLVQTLFKQQVASVLVMCPCKKSQSFELNVKALAFHFFRFRKFSVNFTTVQLISYPDLLRLTFQRKTECHLGTRLASTLCTNVWFNLTCYHSPTRHTPGDLQFFLSWQSMPQPRARKKRQFPTPELLIDLIYMFFLVHLFESTIDFRTKANDVFSELL